MLFKNIFPEYRAYHRRLYQTLNYASPLKIISQSGA